MKIRIQLEEERLRTAAILIKNGYNVQQGKEKRTGTKTLDYYLLVKDARVENGGNDEQ